MLVSINGHLQESLKPPITQPRRLGPAPMWSSLPDSHSLLCQAQAFLVWPPRQAELLIHSGDRFVILFRYLHQPSKFLRVCFLDRQLSSTDPRMPD
jgi:hypothetical protein